MAEPGFTPQLCPELWDTRQVMRTLWASVRHEASGIILAPSHYLPELLKGKGYAHPHFLRTVGHSQQVPWERDGVAGDCTPCP